MLVSKPSKDLKNHGHEKKKKNIQLRNLQLDWRRWGAHVSVLPKGGHFFWPKELKTRLHLVHHNHRPS